MDSPDEIRIALAHEIGTMNYWQFLPYDSKHVITDGVKRMIEMCNAFWLVADIMALQLDPKVRGAVFQVWKLHLNDEGNERNASLICTDGNCHELVREDIEFTDFPLDEGITLFMDDRVLMLASEY